ncbi:amino acid ABC transporter permease [uncultured Leifsonia sp.]|uniref:amino acid ABC transporter permease n=1 Tax=Leifsonia sp. TaxID=1870902 RepID=UPI0028D67335|nr:amino acid ABC transporter permease [uncultured Leifsonia sp.]
MSTRREPIPLADGTAVPIAPRWHWGRWIVGIVAVAAVGWAVSIVVLNPRIRWNEVWHYLFSPNILNGVVVTLWVSVAATLLGLVLGVLFAIMKLSKNPVLRWIAEGYIWFFRGTPVLVQLIFWFNLAFLLPYITLQVPFTQIGLRWDTNQLISGSVAALLGLGLNLAAYFAETVRAGIQAVDHGQTEAALAGGMTRTQAMRLVVLPQALRIIIPPTGNEFISMLKTTSLIVVVAGNDLMTNASNIYKQNNLIIELLIVVSIWYMFLTAVATYLQSLLEKRFGRDRVRLVRGSGFSQQLVRLATGAVPAQRRRAARATDEEAVS